MTILKIVAIFVICKVVVYGNVQINGKDVISYMQVHKGMIEEAQRLYSQSIDSAVLKDLEALESNRSSPGSKSVRLLGTGKDTFLSMAESREVEKGKEIDEEFNRYCNGIDTMVYRDGHKKTILCNRTDILEVVDSISRKKRESTDIDSISEIAKVVEDYVEKCGKKCIISNSLISSIKLCKQNRTKGVNYGSDIHCYRMYVLVYRLIRDTAVIQPSIHHFFDSKPHRKLLTIHNSLEDVPKMEKVLETTLVDCVGQEKASSNSEECMRVFSSDMNTVYKLFNNKIPGSDLDILKTSDPYKNCETHDHIWKNVMVTPSITGDHDSVAYTIKRINEDGANVTLHCLTTVCDICIKEVPILLSGRCKLKHTISSDSHMLQLCNNEKEEIGYFIRLVHSGPRLDSGYTYRSKFFLMNIYTYAHEKIIGSNLRLTEYSNGPQIIKGVIKKESCNSVKIGDLNEDWLQYYVKCGQDIYHHNEHLTEGYRCNLKYEGRRLSGFLKWTCYNWYYIRFFVIIMISILSIYILYVLRVYRYIALFLCMITSPISYLMYKYWPNFARCARCGLPWIPWHSCNEVCLCGEKFDDDHKLNCEFYCIETITEKSVSNKSILFKPVDIAIPNVGSMNYINHVKSQRRRLNQKEKSIDNVEYGNTPDKGERKSRIIPIFQAFSSFRNPFTVFTVRFSLFIFIYVIFCLLIPVSIAECIKCTDRCQWNGKSYTEDCKGINDHCICVVTTVCNSGYTNLIIRSSVNQEIEERVAHKVEGCMVRGSGPVPYGVEYVLAAYIEAQGCYKNLSSSHTAFKRLMLKMSAAMPTYAKIYVLDRSSDDCDNIARYLSERFDLPSSVIEGTRSILNTISEHDSSKNLNVRGIMYSDQATVKPHTQDDFKDSMRPIQDVVEESRIEERTRKSGELLQEFQSILNLLKYNGSIFGRDHTITIPQAPSFIQHIYTAQSTESTTVLDMTMQAIAGSAAAFRPVSKGKEVPITFVVSVPEVAGIYTMRYQYTTCKTSVIDTVRCDNCVGSCDTCFKYLHESTLDNTKMTKFFDPDQREKVSFDNPNTWGCEGSGCWTINTGCLCAYCSNIPDPRDCFDVYSVSYHSSRALVCLSINEDHQCEQITVGKPVERQGKVQLLLEGNDEWSSLIKTEMIAVHRESGKILMGLINGLGESTGNFGSPQYNKNLSLLYKIPDVDAHYVCKTGSDQEVIFDSCFKDTWLMKKDLQESASFFLDSNRGYIYHVGKNVGTLKIILNVPVEKVEWKTTDLNIKITQADCYGCYSCINGIHCTIEAESTHSGLAYIYINPCTVRVSTVNILRGMKRYNITLDCNEKPMKPYVVIRDGNEKEIARKILRMTLNEGNTPRTTERNSTNNEYNIAGQNDNTLSGLGDFFKKWNPITAISNFFSSSIVHWLLYLLISIITIAALVFVIYYIATVTLRKVTNKVILGKQE